MLEVVPQVGLAAAQVGSVPPEASTEGALNPLSVLCILFC